MNVQHSRMRTIDLAMIALMAAMIAICAWISIPATVPFTLQTFGVFLAVGLLGGKNGTWSVLVYLLLGLIGAPVFAGFSGGISVLFGKTGGYILGFLLSALCMWLMEHLFGSKKWVLAVSMVLGLLLCYIFGTAWFMIVFTKTSGAITLGMALSWCVLPYILPDLLKILLALFIRDRLHPVLRRFL